MMMIVISALVEKKSAIKDINYRNIEKIKTYFLPYISANLGRKHEASAHPTNCIEPISPI